MGKGFVLSLLFHVGIVAFSLIGLPRLSDPPPLIETVIPVEFLELAERAYFVPERPFA